MEYPDDFNTPAFPAGKRIAVARAMAIAAMAGLLLVAFLCLFIFWGTRSRRVDPFIISMNPTTGEWTIVGHSHDENTYSVAHNTQVAVVGNFVRDWFALSSDTTRNQNLWAACDAGKLCTEYADLPYGTRMGAICCASADGVYSMFMKTVVPDYTAWSAAGETLSLDMDSMEIIPVGVVKNNGGTWRVLATVNATVAGPIQVIAYVGVGRDDARYPRTFGYHITKFNSYRLN